MVCNTMACNHLPAALHALITCVPADVVKFILLEKIIRIGRIRFVQCFFAFDQKQGTLQRCSKHLMAIPGNRVRSKPIISENSV